MKLTPQQVEKPWGRTSIPRIFGNTGGKRIGEIWFEHEGIAADPLLVKYIFTSEKLSVQVHPSDEQAHARGLPSGKSECWYILDAEPSATLGLGLKKEISAAELRAAALDGSIEQLMDWRHVTAGDFFFVPAGTVHAIGAGISLVEFQQNADVTYRLYDYGRPRELHLNDGIAVSRPEPFPDRWARPAGGPVDAALHSGPQFTLVRAEGLEAIPATLMQRRRWVMPIQGAVAANGEQATAGECLLVEPGASIDFGESAVALVGSEGAL